MSDYFYSVLVLESDNSFVLVDTVSGIILSSDDASSALYALYEDMVKRFPGNKIITIAFNKM